MIRPEPDEYTIGGINELVIQCGNAAISKGFRTPEEIRNLGMVLMLITSELGEAMEEVRNISTFESMCGKPKNIQELVKISPAYHRLDSKGKPEGLIVELADTVIRVFDMAHELGCDCFGEIILQKLAYNESRPPKHGRQC